MNPSGIEAYRLGRSFDVMPIPMDLEHCVEVPAGPLTFVVESRRLTDEAINSNARDRGRPDATYDSGIDDGGACVHVLGTADRLERLRFDCFDNEPHYHYIHQSEQVNVVVRFDQFAEGDPREWTLERLRSRLPHMLEHLGSVGLADEVRAVDLSPAVDEVARLLDVAG
ncbi:hypothetical protein AB4Z09_01960 [Rhodococcus sp. TAF43]|uniref:DUF7700 domain-containing protein n=1 Tax=unclassified Rhodococcus (in: high G+C Gram-positive bacteria) TaxID=192944 RepID=UPI0015835224|nr:hypothetical protein [Rhodococcus sp. W8901]QKT10860.1 hypothetical protein HUN07_09130 [Rhodococcus sp. W8901]